MKSRPRVDVLPTPDDLHRHFAALVAGALREAIEARGRASLALSRASQALRPLAEAPLPWGKVDVFQVDERAAAKGSEDRNLTAIERDLVGRVAGARPQLYPMPVDGDLEDGARAYGAELEAHCGRPVVLDVIHLGLGSDGHTASLFGGDEALGVGEAPVATTNSPSKGGHRRMTLTLPVLDRGRLVVFLVSGRAKAEVVKAVVDGDPALPAARVRASDVRFLIDEAAASHLKSVL